MEQEIPEGRPEKLTELMSAEFRTQVQGAEVIRGIDQETGNEFIVFGMSTLESIEASHRPKPFVCLSVSVLQRTDELETLCAAVKEVKGYIDYKAGSHYRRHRNS